MSAKLNFGSAGSPFDDTAVGGFDAAPGANGFDLAGFDSADGRTTVPPGVYTLRIEKGELTQSKTGKPMYRLRFAVVEPSSFAGFVIFRNFVLTDPASCNRAKNALAPLGLTTSAALKSPFPPLGKDVFAKALVTVRPAQNGYPESNDLERFEPCPPPAGAVAPPNPFAVNLDAPVTPKEGGRS